MLRRVRPWPQDWLSWWRAIRGANRFHMHWRNGILTSFVSRLSWPCCLRSWDTRDRTRWSWWLRPLATVWFLWRAIVAPFPWIMNQCQIAAWHPSNWMIHTRARIVFAAKTSSSFHESKLQVLFAPLEDEATLWFVFTVRAYSAHVLTSHHKTQSPTKKNTSQATSQITKITVITTITTTNNKIIQWLFLK